MRLRFVRAFFALSMFLLTTTVFAQTLGTYPNTSMFCGRNENVFPSVFPTSITRIAVSTTPTFLGTLTVGNNGAVYVVNAQPAGTYPITIKAYNGASSVTQTFTLTVTNANCSQGLFTATTNTVGASPRAVVIGDFNQDARQDFVTANSAANNLSVRIRDAFTNTYTSTANVPTGTTPVAIAVGDFDINSQQDLAVANFGSNNVSILLSSGPGTFSAAATVSVGAGPSCIAVGDFNNDGIQDFVTGNSGNVNAPSASVRLGNGFNGFTNAPDITFPFLTVAPVVHAIAIGDFNLDGKQDLAITTENPSEVTLHIGDGLGGFTRVTDAAQRIFVPDVPVSIAMADVNNNGVVDLVTTNYFNNSISVRFGNGTGGFVGNSSYNFPVGTSPEHLAIVDVNGDGHLDIVVCLGGTSTGSIAVMRGNSTGTFTAGPGFSPLISPVWVAAGDFNQDRRMDLLVANNGASPTVSVLLGGINEINVKGNNTNIVDGDITPTLTDHTDFGTVSGSFARTFTIQNTGTTVMQISSVTSSNSQFTISGAPATIAGGDSANFQITFNGTAGGAQNSTITILNNDCDEATYDFVVTAAIQPTIGNYPNITVRAADDTTLLPLTMPLAGRMTAFTNARFRGQFVVNPTTGVVRILNPQPAGTYTVTVKAFNGTGSVTKTFTLTVTAPLCSSPGFTSTSAQDLSVTVSPNGIQFADFNNDGFQDIITSNNSSNATLRLGTGLGTFGAASTITLGSAPRGVAIGDFNGDGNLDFLCADRSGANVYVRLGDGLGGFTSAPLFNIGNLPEFVTVADFNNDGILDLASANFGAGTVSIGLGNGLGGFTAATAVTVGTSPRHIATADFNGDGNIDLAVANSGSASISIRLGNGAGGFTGTTEVAVATNPYQVAVGDFNNDGFPDFVCTSNANPSQVRVRLGDGLGGFTSMPDLTVGFSTFSLAVADFNADNKLDLAIGEGVTNMVYVRTGDGSGNFAAATSSSINSGPVALAVGDVNNDGVLDFVSASSIAATGINIRLGVNSVIRVRGNNTEITSGDITPSLVDHTEFGGLSGSLTRSYTIQNPTSNPVTINSITSSNPQFVVSNVPTTIAGGASAVFQVTATPSGSGIQASTITINSIVCANGVFTFQLNATALPVLGDYSNASVVWGSNKTFPPLTAPVNRERIMAFSTPNFGGAFSVNSITAEVQVSGAQVPGVYPITVVAFNGIYTDTTRFNLTVTKPNCGPGVFTGTTNVNVGTQPITVVLGDFNRDNKQDLVSADFQGGTISIRIGDGLGGFSGTTSLTGLFQPRAIAVADFNRDGAEDLAITSVAGVSIYNGNGIGGFNALPVISNVSITNDITAADVNQDGFVDLLITAVSANGIELLLGNGNSGFAAPISISLGAGASPQALDLGDFNNDGFVDVAVANSGLGTVAILLGNGNGTFTAAASLTVGTGPSDIALGDFNGDGQIDLAIANNVSNNISIRLGAGNGTFTTADDIALGVKPYSIAAGDFNGDGRVDLIVANQDDGTLAIRLGTGTGTFTGTNTITLPSPRGLVVGNFNGDGFQDIATTNFGSASISVRIGTGNSIQLQGNSQNIVDGANTTSLNNHTDFGVLADTLQRTFTIQNTGTAPLVIDSIRSSNPFFLIRNAPTSAAAGASATFRVTYNFGGTGIQTSTIRVYNNNCDFAEYDFVVRAEKDNPPVLGNYPPATLSAGNTILIMPNAAPVGANRITAYTTNGFPGTLAVDSITGALRVVTANEIGTFVITIRAQRGQLFSTKTCTITVTNTLCSSGSFVGTTSISAGNAPRDVVAGDFNQDGIPDLAVANYSSSSVSIRLGDGLGGFTGTDSILVAPNPTALAVADFNGDGKQDLAISIFSTPARSVSIRFGNGLGGFSGNTEVTINAGFSSAVVAADFNQDGNMDFASANSSNIVSIHLGNGVGGFTNPTNINVGANTELRSIALADFNKDGFPDLVAGLYQTNAVRILLNDGLGGFTANAPVTVGLRPNAVIAADFNADGNIDIATANAQAFSVSIRLGDGLGGLSGTTEVTGLSAGVFDLGTGDFNGDGKLDIAVAINSNFNAVDVRFGNGAGQFSGQLSVPAGLRPYGIVIGDWNKDGRQDFATSNETGRSISIRMGDASGDNVWLGLSSDWNDPANWSSGVGPGICTRAVINPGVPNMPVITDPNASCGSLRVNPGAT
ncbi:MAG: FG-GAP-like repeat-containing protein, partial [Ferruginibacter sp.]